MADQGGVVLALDIGGTKIAGAIIDENGRIVMRTRRPTARGGLLDPAGTVTAFVVSELLDLARTSALPVIAVGAGYPEYVSAAGTLRSCEVLPDAFESPRRIRELCPGIPIVIESDVRAGAAAEATWGAGRGATSMLYVSLGTGLSTTLVVDGRLLTGHRGEALALGELDVSRRGLQEFPGACAEVDTLNLESFCSGSGIARRYASRSGSQVDGAAEVTARVDRDELAREIIVTAGIALGRALAGQAAISDPERVVVGGGLGCAPGLLADIVRQTYESLTGRRPIAPKLFTAQAGDDGGLLGAAAVAQAASKQEANSAA
jgi:glucokinase